LCVVNCSNLIKINNIPSLNTLICKNCPKLNKLPNFPNLEILVCNDCSNLTKLPNMQKLISLECSNSVITKLRGLPKLRELYCIGCKILTKIPNNDYNMVMNIDSPFLFIPKENKEAFKSTLFIWKLRRHRMCACNKVNKKGKLYDILLPKDIIQYVILKY